MQPGDMQVTYADPRLLEALTGFRPATSVQDGVTAFVHWYLQEWSSRPTIAA
jgi:UDP-glucuronate 4-epimerase